MRRLLPLLLLLCLLTGCTFPYFNIYYNAKNYFDDAREAALRDDGKPTPAAIANYNKAITKCSRIMTDFPKSKWADDALFLLAQSLFYRANSYTQAEDKFKELLTYYPDSRFVPESKIFMARCEYEIGHKQNAYLALQDFLLHSEYSDKHPMVLVQLSDYYLRDKEYNSAVFYLNRLINDYPKADEYKSAFFLLGKSYYDSRQYARSDSIFQELLKSGVPRRTKLDGRYYIGLNKLELHDYSAALKLARKLQKDEYLTANLARVEIIRGRALIGLGETDQAKDVLTSVIKNNSRSLASAEANYWLGEMYFSVLLDNSEAKTYFDKVETEASRSPFVPQAKTRSAVVSQIIQFSEPSTSIPSNQLIDQQLKLAENYLDILDMPDSALAIYDRIPLQRTYYLYKHDSLSTEIARIESIPDTVYTRKIDSLTVVKGNLERELVSARGAIDSTRIRETQTVNRRFDDLRAQLESIPKEDTLRISLRDSLTKVVDSLDVVRSDLRKLPPDPAVLRADSLLINLNAVDQKIAAQMQARTNRSGLDRMKTDSAKNQADVEAYDSTYIPFSRFIKTWVYRERLADTLRARETLELMQSEHPDNRYTYAAEKLLGGEPVEITTPRDLQTITAYEQAERTIDSDPGEAARQFELLISVENPRIADQALLASAYVEYFCLGDSIETKAKFDSLLARHPASDISEFISIFYSDKHFKHLEHLPYLIQLEYEALHPEEKEKRKEEEQKKKSGNKDRKPGKDNKQPPSAEDKKKSGDTSGNMGGIKKL